MMNYEETLNYIHKVSWTGSRPGLERITELLGLIGNPQDSLKFIHVAGTNGKGSFCSMCDSVLRAAGYKVGLYTSPYIERFNERMAVNGEAISDDELSCVTSYVREFADHMTDQPTEFELITAVAMEYFRRNRCDIVVLEVGMGGRLDATNIIKEPILSVITGISKDHTAFLGDTVEQIAAEKAGIIKRGVPVLFGGNDENARRVIEEKARQNESDFFVTKRDTIKLVRADFSGTEFVYDGETAQISLLGLYQPYNASNVIEAVRILRSRGMEISDSALKDGLKNAVWKGRFQLLLTDPIFIIDGSHNPEGISAAVEGVKHYFGDGKVCLLSGVMADKDYSAMAKELSEIACVAVTLRPDNPRSLDPKKYADEFRKNGVEAYSGETINDAAEIALREARQRGVGIVALGSLYMYKDVKDAVYAAMTDAQK